jgi:DNA-binding response OmpR family regulator
MEETVIMNTKQQGNEVKDILLVDDEAELRLVVGSVLDAKGFQVVTADDPTDAMKKLDEFQFRMTILDINLAGEDGLRLLSFIKKNHPGCMVMLYTGLSHEEERIQEMLKMGATCYVNKAQPTAELLFAVAEVLTAR